MVFYIGDLNGRLVLYSNVFCVYFSCVTISRAGLYDTFLSPTDLLYSSIFMVIFLTLAVSLKDSYFHLKSS